MRKRDDTLLEILNPECNGETVYFVGLGFWDFQLAFGNISTLQTLERADFRLGGDTYSWIEGSTDIPVGLLIGQTPKKFKLPTEYSLKLQMTSGDIVELFTAEHGFESTIIEISGVGAERAVHVF